MDHFVKRQKTAMLKVERPIWIRLIILVILPLTLFLCPSCQFHDDKFVDFTDIEAAKGLKFKVIGQHETDLNNGFPSNCYLPDGTPVNEYVDEPVGYDAQGDEAGSGPLRTTSVTGASILQELIKYKNQTRVTEIVGTYPSINGNRDTIQLSGKVILPTGRKPKRMILVSHYTVGSNREAPSNCFSLEGVLAELGYGLILPDYIGYGVTVNEVHPYLVMDLTAHNVVDMYLAVRPWLKAIDMEPEQPGIILMGYSQGGANTMAVQHLIETEYDYYGNPERIFLHRVFAGGGPYDVKATYERFVTTDTAGYPVAVPLVLQGMIKGNNLNMQMSDMMQQWLCDKMDDWINSKLYCTNQLNKFIGTKVTHELLTQEAMDQTSDKVAELYKAMNANSIISYNWMPSAPVYLMHSMDDETVPYTNAANAKNKWQYANIRYNFGHYGGHVLTCLRFIAAVRELLLQEEKEKEEYEAQ